MRTLQHFYLLEAALVLKRKFEIMFAQSVKEQ